MPLLSLSSPSAMSTPHTDGPYKGMTRAERIQAKKSESTLSRAEEIKMRRDAARVAEEKQRLEAEAA